MAALYTNNFRGRAGRKERAKHLRNEFANIEAAFARLQALNVANYLTIYTNTTTLSGVITIIPDNGYLQELTLTSNTSIQMASPTNADSYRVSLLIHGSDFKVTNLWGAQTWKEYGLGNWWEMYTGEGPYASMLLDFYWDICSNTWICVASSKNQFNTLAGGTVQRFYPLVCDLANTEGDDTLGFSRASPGSSADQNEAYHYLPSGDPRYHGSRYVENWCATPSDLTTVAWRGTDVTVTTDAGAGPSGENVQRLSFDATGGKLATYVLPAFGRASRHADPIKVAVSFKCKAVSGTTSLRVHNAFMGKTSLTPPVHDAVQIDVDTTWQSYGCVLDVVKSGNADTSLTLDANYPKTLMEIALVSPSGSAGAAIQVTDVQIEVLRVTDTEIPSELQDGTIGASMTLTATGTGAWVNATKTLTLSGVGQYMDFSENLEIGQTYLVHLRLQSGDACDIRMQNEVTVWAAGTPSDATYLQDAPFVFQYDGGNLKFVLMAGSSSVYLMDIYELSGNRNVYCRYNTSTLGADYSLTYAVGEAVSSGTLDGVAREIASENLIPYNFYRTLSSWDAVGLAGVEADDCRNPVYQSEYGIDMWPARATILQGSSKVADGYIQRLFTIPQTTETYDFTMWVRRSLDAEGNQVVTPQHNDVTVPVSQYIDFEAELVGGTTEIGGGRTRLDIQNSSFVKEDGYGYTLGIFKWDNWFHIVISLDNDGTHNGFRVRVYPASADDPDPSVIDVSQQGWVIVDWAQFEEVGGTHKGSSPIVGGETRAIENFTTGLPDGFMYRAEGMGRVAVVTGGALIWDLDDDVYKNLIYSTTEMLTAVVAKNMHEFGLVEVVAQPSPELTIATTTLYPVEAKEAVEFSISLQSGAMRDVPEDSLDTEYSLVYGDLSQILLSAPVEEDGLDLVYALNYGSLRQILLSAPVEEDGFDVEYSLVYGELDSKLVTAIAPDEAVEFSLSLIAGTLDTP